MPLFPNLDIKSAFHIPDTCTRLYDWYKIVFVAFVFFFITDPLHHGWYRIPYHAGKSHYTSHYIGMHFCCSYIIMSHETFQNFDVIRNFQTTLKYRTNRTTYRWLSALELPQSCTKPLIYDYWELLQYISIIWTIMRNISNPSTHALISIRYHGHTIWYNVFTLYEEHSANVSI